MSLSRRDWFRLSGAGVLGASVSGWLPALAAETAKDPRRKRACILLWMDGGPSQLDTFDPKPDHPNGGPFKPIATNVNGIRISEHLPKIAQHMDKMALVRSMSTREGDHSRGSLIMHTGYMPAGEINYPSIGGLLARELGEEEAVMPPFVCVAPNRGVSPQAFSSGFLGPRFAPLVVGGNNLARRPGAFDYEAALRVPDLEPSRFVLPAHADARIELLEQTQRDFAARHPGLVAGSHQSAYDRAVKLMRTAAAKAFNLEEEKASLRDSYGRNMFGQSCLLARRLVESGVAFVEVNMGGVNGGQFGWDTHQGNFDAVKNLSAVLDPAWATLMSDLKDRGMLDSTLIVWMGEFGRTPRIDPQRNGRDHFPNGWTTVLAGGGIKGGQAVGATSVDGMTIKERPVTTPDLLATVCKALGIDPSKQNNSNVGRPIRIVDKAAKPIAEVVG